MNVITCSDCSIDQFKPRWIVTGRLDSNVHLTQLMNKSLTFVYQFWMHSLSEFQWAMNGTRWVLSGVFILLLISYTFIGFDWSIWPVNYWFACWNGRVKTVVLRQPFKRNRSGVTNSCVEQSPNAVGKQSHIYWIFDSRDATKGRP